MEMGGFLGHDFGSVWVLGCLWGMRWLRQPEKSVGQIKKRCRVCGITHAPLNATLLNGAHPTG
ncbi:hypothetical protein GCWU000324_02024 [Kingella oralis ATCC 51147]|uniref:Uncharacterized protein n=1 Tax=Kingella oralis ATCC 51147 TaxID=629741 RepID=C4GJ03_9NEIS|nr:hypothetical protein GCWU000324_02024 [Kingella oralis ATCC 51147]